MTRPNHGPTAWLVGGGQMGEIIRSTDWSATPLGPPEQWPSCLRTALGIVLESQIPMALLWGQELILLYNDAYRAIAADQSLRTLGRSTREISSGISQMKPSILTAVERGLAACLEDEPFFVERQGQREEAYFTLCYSPVRAGDGGVAGSLVSLVETTPRIRAHRSLQTERELFAKVMDRIPVMVTIYDPALQSFHLNQEFRRALGWTEEDARRHDLMELCYPDPQRREEVRRFMETPQTNWREFQVTAKDGSVVASSWANARLSDNTQIGIGIDLRERKRSEAAVRDSQDLLRSTLDHFPSVIAYKDREGRFIDVNKVVEKLLGKKKEEVVGLTDYDLMPKAQADLFRQHDVEVMQSRTAMVREELTPLPDGPLHHLDVSFPLIDSRGDVYGVGHISHDLTRLKSVERALRESEKRYRTLFEAIDAGFCSIELVFDQEGRGVDYRFLEMNPAFERQTGLVNAQGRLVRELVPLLESRWPETYGRVALTGKPERFEEESTAMGRWFDVYAFRIGPPEERTVALLFTDITARKRADHALREANERLHQVNRHKNEFLAVLSHELRNPLAPIRNSVFILDHAVPGGEQARRARQVIDRQAQQLTRLIDDLLDITRISSGKVNLQRERVDLAALVSRTAEDHRSQYARNGIGLEVKVSGEDLYVEGDPTRLAQVIGNLLNNSSKFTPRGGRTLLSVEPNAQEEVVVRICDDGAGMSKETLEHLFEPFVQAAQTIDRSRGGLGLGLSLVKGLVEMHGGSVTAHSGGEDEGSLFTVTLPLQQPPRPRRAVAGAPNRSPGARRVLVVEDNLDAAESLREALEFGNHEVAIAHTGPEGVEVARSYKPDIVLCDIGLPGLDGHGVARALRADPDAELRSTYLVALSGYALKEDVMKSKEAGFNQHLAKPPSIAALEELMEQAGQ